jgi:hypothetical protein
MYVKTFKTDSIAGITASLIGEAGDTGGNVC